MCKEICSLLLSRPSRGAWIEIILAANTQIEAASRPSRGAWIEIYLISEQSNRQRRSRPSRGAWIEIKNIVGAAAPTIRRAPRGARGLKCPPRYYDKLFDGRAPRGARGLKYQVLYRAWLYYCRAPRGARGLKFCLIAGSVRIRMSRPSRGAWIEMILRLRRVWLC